MLTPATLAVRPECGWGLGTATGRAERTIRPGGLPRTREASGSPGTRRRGRATRQVGPRVTHFRPAFRFEGPQTLQQQNQRAGGRRLGCSPRPPATCSRQGRTGPGAALPCPARGLGLTAGRALRPTFPAATAPPRETRGGPWPPLNCRKGAAAAEDARPDCAASGPTREQKVAGPAAFSQARVRWSPAERTGGEGCTHGRDPRRRRRCRRYCPSSLVPAMAFVSSDALVTDLDTEY